jgi:hypothetical protein
MFEQIALDAVTMLAIVVLTSLAFIVVGGLIWVRMSKKNE